jgi:hypothetical protein
MMPLTSFNQEKPLNLIQTGLIKEGRSIEIDTDLVFSRSREFYDHFIVGTMPARDGKLMEYVLGLVQQYKHEDFIREGNIRITRLRSKTELAQVINGIQKTITTK